MSKTGAFTSPPLTFGWTFPGSPTTPTAPRISHSLAAVHGQPHGHLDLRAPGATARQARGVGLAKGALGGQES